MEPAQTPVRTIYTVKTKVKAMKKNSPEGSGYWVLLEGSWEWLYIGDTDPEWRVGDKVTIKLENQDHG